MRELKTSKGGCHSLSLVHRWVGLSSNVIIFYILQVTRFFVTPGHHGLKIIKVILLRLLKHTFRNQPSSHCLVECICLCILLLVIVIKELRVHITTHGMVVLPEECIMFKRGFLVNSLWHPHALTTLEKSSTNK